MYEPPKLSMQKSFRSQEQQVKERSLIAKTAAGDGKAFEQLYRLYFNRLYQFIFHVVWEKASTYNHTCRPSTWILGIAYLKALKSAEQSLIRENRSAEFNDELDYFPDSGSKWISELEVSNWLEVAFDKLSIEQRAVVEMTYYQGLHYNEISEIM